MGRKVRMDVYVDAELADRIDELDEDNSAYFRRLAKEDLEVKADA